MHYYCCRTIIALALLLLSSCYCFTPLSESKRRPPPIKLDASTTNTAAADSSNSPFFFAQAATPATTRDDTLLTTNVKDAATKGRPLGSQELLMLPRQYKPNNDNNNDNSTIFPQMNHVTVALLNKTPSQQILKQAVDSLLSVHPILSCRVDGDGEPTERIDAFNMVRKGNPDPCTFVVDNKITSNAVIKDVITVSSSADFDETWQSIFAKNLDDGSWCNVATGPLWKLDLVTATFSSDNINSSNNANKCAVLLSFNHAISDQGSANRLLDQLVSTFASLEGGINKQLFVPQTDLAVSVEESVLGKDQQWDKVQTKGLSIDTVKYVAAKAAEGFNNPVILPEAVSSSSQKSNSISGSLEIISGKAAGGSSDSTERRTLVQFRTIANTQALLQACRKNGVTISNAFSAAATYAATNYISIDNRNVKKRNYKVLQSLDMRRFGTQACVGNTVGCLAGSMDLMHGPLDDFTGRDFCKNPTAQRRQQFWDLARQGKQQTLDFIKSDGPTQAVRVFDFAMSISDMNNLVHLTAESKDTLGRAYSVGVTNVGVFENQDAFLRNDGRSKLATRHGSYEITDVYFATTHVRSGALFPVSCVTINNELKLTFNPVSPIVNDEQCTGFADSLVDILNVAADESCNATATIANEQNAFFEVSKNNMLTTISAIVGSAAVLSHAPAWASFFASVAEMKSNIEDPTQFWAALNFWIFFAVGHPLLSPILWISDVLHGSPGPKIAGLVPLTFIAGNAAVIWLITAFKDFRNAVNIAAVCAFFAYVGSGLDGTAGLGDYNLALDDSHQGRVVKGCPSYDQVRQSSMDNFDLEKYQGKWYEHKFHDWTQFKEVYDTTLDIKLTPDGKGWIDDFAVKGPAPDAAPLSWDKSPVANGAHYFLFGRVDSKDPPGVLRESGFGVEFPNYIVDVQKDAKGEYKEAIQFQCLERGGVRVFEGINFMSRNPTMTQSEMQAMHARAEKAGMYPYGASPEQMHTVARRPVDAPDIDNNWQAMWRAIGVDKLLELLTKSIEDGGR